MKDKYLTIRFSDSLRKRIEKKAKELECSKSEVVRMAVIKYINKI